MFYPERKCVPGAVPDPFIGRRYITIRTVKGSKACARRLMVEQVVKLRKILVIYFRGRLNNVVDRLVMKKVFTKRIVEIKMIKGFHVQLIKISMDKLCI